MPDEAIRLSEVLREEYVRLHGPLPDGAVAALSAAGDNEEARVKAMYSAIHALDADHARTALCISGGGIRSATFALGVLQRLASFGLLTQFHYLSTISGGGYIGSWLSSFVRRSSGGMEEVQHGIQGLPREERNPLEPEIAPLRWLRQFSNYLTPKLGLMSGDSWAFAGSYLRNLLLVWLMFVPVLAAVLAVPRLAIAILRLQYTDRTIPVTTAVIAGVLILIGTAFVALTRPVSHKREGWLTNGRFMRCVLLPYAVAALLLVIYWAARYRELTLWQWWPVFAGFIGINTLSSLVYMVRFFIDLDRQRQRNVRSDSTKTKYAWKKFFLELIAAAIAGAVGAVLLFATIKIFQNPVGEVELPSLDAWKTIPPQLSHGLIELYLMLAVPVVLLILFVQSAVFVGLSSWFNEEYDREWWGRAAGWVLLAGLAWIIITAIVIYGPVAIYEAPRIFAILTGGTGLFSVIGGKSGTTGATDKEKSEKAGPAQTAMTIGLGLVTPLFVIAVLALISLCTSRISLALYPPASRIDATELELRSKGTYQIKEPENLNFETSRFPAAEKDRINALEHLYAVDRTTWQEGLVLVFGLSLFGWIVSYFIGANQFSMHGLYRNRIIRGFLGGPHAGRAANRFSGFDPSDNLPMDRLRPEVFLESTLRDIAASGPKIVADKALESVIQDATRKAVETDPQNAAELLVDDLNRAIDTLTLANPGQLPQSVANRLELERRHPGAFVSMSAHERPMHLIGTALNLVSGDNLAWQERKASSFTVTPVHSGSHRLGYRPTRVYGGPSGISIGTAVAISGAAASPNMGYHSSPALSFLLTLFNVRLGWWLGNPKKDSYVNANPANTMRTVLDEAFGNTNDENPYVYLSDGGHFDNLGLYEMVLRRCRCIVVSDAGADPDFGFEDLGNAIRKIRIDLGVDIKITYADLFPRSQKTPGKYCAIGRILYTQSDPGAKEDGLLLYLKPTFYGKAEPKDVYNYATIYADFPHQSTGDQWFSESQFESYRQLGYYALGEVASGKTSFDRVCDLITQAETYAKGQ